MPTKLTTEALSSRRRTGVLALMCSALAVVMDVAQAAFVHGLRIAFYGGAGAVLLGTLVFLRLAPRRAPRRATAPALDGAGIG